MSSPEQLLKKQDEISSTGIRKQATLWFMIVGIIFIAANLRAPLTSVGPLVSIIRENVHISNTLAGLITTVPLIAFALLSPFVPKLL
jgi:MFS transporter, CP family, cyanate transporter